MSERFSAIFLAAASGTDKTMTGIIDAAATPTCRGCWYDLVIGSDDTPGDQAARFVAGRITAQGTGGTNFTPINLDPGGPAGVKSSHYAPSAEPTYTANKELLVFSLNQRATFRWVAAPGSELWMAATQNNGIGLKSKNSTSTQAMDGCVLFRE